MELINKKTNKILELYQILKKNDGITKKNIVSALYKNARSIERYLDYLQNDFNIYYKISSHYRYVIDYDKTVQKDLDRIERAISLYGTALFQLKHNGESDFVEDEDNTIGLGNMYLDDIYDAIISKFKIEFSYKGYWKNETETVQISPVLLKQHNQRWYIVANEKDNKMYSLDRISSLSILTKDTFYLHGNKKGMFDNVIGISQANLETERVVLAFNPRQGKYIKSLPLHKTQQVVSDDENSLVIELNIGINWELKEKIKMQGSLVKVLEPKHLIDEIKEDIAQALKQHN